MSWEGRLCLAAFYRPPKLLCSALARIQRHTYLREPLHSTCRNLSQIKKAWRHEKKKTRIQQSGNIVENRKRNEKKKKRECWRAIFRQRRLLMHKPNEKWGKREQQGFCLSQRWALTEILYACDLTYPSLCLFLLFQHLSEHVLRSSWNEAGRGKTSFTLSCRLCKHHLLSLKVWSYFLPIPSNPYLTRRLD